MEAYLNISERQTKGAGICSTPNTTKYIIHYLRAACRLHIGTNSKPRYLAADVCTICENNNLNILAFVYSGIIQHTLA